MNAENDETASMELEQIVKLALAEDLGSEGDITSKAIFVSGSSGAARVIAREECIVSGLDAAREVCRQIGGIDYLPLVEAGQSVPAAAEIIRLDGELLAILAAERTLLNFISRLAGIATLTRRYVDEVEGFPVEVAATRKTSPGLRRLEKEAVVDGGGELHRIGLFDAVLIKDNHIAAAGGITAAVAAVREREGEAMGVEVEVDTREQLREALETGADAILLDNMAPDEVRDCVKIVAGKKVLEASGGIVLDNIRSYAETGVDRISVGYITRSAAGIDFSLEVVGGD
jgi:nicotinate-nucleotide pyrophosphorylase (carboxylating)